MRRVQFILRDGETMLGTLDVPGAHIPAEGDEYLLHVHGTDEPDRWVVAAVVRELWPGPSDVRLSGRPLKVVDEEEYHEGDTVVVILVQKEETKPVWEDGALNAAIKHAAAVGKEHGCQTDCGREHFQLVEWLKELRRRRAEGQANGEPPPYDPSFGDNKLCRCGHTYERHFDTYDNMSPVGCKYCGYDCDGFEYDPDAVED